MHLNCYVKKSFLLLEVFRVFTAVFWNAMLTGGARKPTTCSIESSYRFLSFVYNSHHRMPSFCLGAFFMSAQFCRLVFLRLIVVFFNGNHTNFQSHVFRGAIVRKNFILRRDTLESEPLLPSTAFQSSFRNVVAFPLPNKFHLFGYWKQVMNFLGRHEPFVHPRKISLGGDYETRYHNRLPQQMSVVRKTQFISLADFLMKVILLSDEVISQGLKCQQLLSELPECGILLHGQQLTMDRSPSAKVDATRHADSTDLILSIQLYFDEVEPANPIGTRANIQRVGCFYWSFKSLPPWMNEDSRWTHVVAIATILDLKTYGFEPLVKEFFAWY